MRERERERETVRDREKMGKWREKMGILYYIGEGVGERVRVKRDVRETVREKGDRVIGEKQR